MSRPCGKHRDPFPKIELLGSYEVWPGKVALQVDEMTQHMKLSSFIFNFFFFIGFFMISDKITWSSSLNKKIVQKKKN